MIPDELNTKQPLIVYLLEIYQQNTYSYSGEDSRPEDIYFSKEDAEEAGKLAVKNGYRGFSVEPYKVK